MPKRIIVSVINDLATDQRVAKTCDFLHRQGFELVLVGRLLEDSLPLIRSYRTHRMKLLFTRGPLFYLEYNFRLFLFLLKEECDVLLANDLDTLLANYLSYSSKRNTELVYDSHEYFTEVPELQGRWAKKVWSTIERWIFPRLKHVYTVNRSIADIYEQKYKVPVKVVHNFPDQRGLKKVKERCDLGLPENKRVLILQGAGLNLDRGGEEAIMAMRALDDKYFLLVLGGGDNVEKMKGLCLEFDLSHRIRFEPKMPYQDMMQFTFNADLGLNLDKGSNANYKHALPNKVVDYIAAGIPVLSSDLVETGRLIREHRVGHLISEVTPEKVAEGVGEAFADTDRYRAWKQATEKAREALNWENEEETLKEIYGPLG